MFSGEHGGGGAGLTTGLVDLRGLLEKTFHSSMVQAWGVGERTTSEL